MDLETLNEFHKPNNKTFNKWFKRVLDDKTPWTETEIRYFRKFCKGHSNKYGILMDNFKASYSITSEQTKKGIEYITKVCFKKNGELRRTKNMPFGIKESEIIKNFKEFRFIGIADIGNYYSSLYVPIYRVIATNGKYFDYTASMWGNMEVVG